MNSEETAQSDSDFFLLSDLLFSTEDSAEGRASFPLEDSEKLLLERMAGGICTKEERKSAIDLLVSNREAMDYFADALRGGGSRQVAAV